MIELVVAQLKDLKAGLEESELFRRHHLYGASVTILISYEHDAEVPVLVKLSDVGNLAERAEMAPLKHIVEDQQLPLAADDIEDGFLTGLGTLIEFFEAHNMGKTTDTLALEP